MQPRPDPLRDAINRKRAMPHRSAWLLALVRSCIPANTYATLLLLLTKLDWWLIVRWRSTGELDGAPAESACKHVHRRDVCHLANARYQRDAALAFRVCNKAHLSRLSANVSVGHANNECKRPLSPSGWDKQKTAWEPQCLAVLGFSLRCGAFGRCRCRYVSRQARNSLPPPLLHTS